MIILARNVRVLVWCRDGEVCSNATPCEKLSCKYKNGKEDILKGVEKCQHFAVTTSRHVWNDASHLDVELKDLYEPGH